MSTNIPDDSVSQSKPQKPYIQHIEAHKLEQRKELNEKISKELNNRQLGYGEIASKYPQTEFTKGEQIKSSLDKFNLTPEIKAEMKADLEAGMTAEEFFEKYKDSIIKDMGL